MNKILEFSATDTYLVEQVGSKAYAMMEMAKKGYPVPPGIVLTVGFFDPWLNLLQNRPEWEAVMQASLETLHKAAKAFKAICHKMKFTFQQKDELVTALAPLGAISRGIFAVRSSSPEEDLEGASFAGGYETSLGVTLENLNNAIVHSFASAFDERVFLYKIQQGIQLEKPRIAVIVQQQIDASSAGVAFSVNPVNNCYDEAVINANFGLGESVVAGVVEPDHLIVDKLTHQILETRVGKKKTVITLNPDGGVKQSSRENDGQVCLAPQQVEAISRLLAKIEVDYRHPVDIEWAFSREELYLLQVRPITTYLPLPEKMVTAPGEPKRLYADSTLIEQGVEKPLSILGTDFLRYVLNTMTGPMGGSADEVDGGTFTAGGRYYMNLSQTMQMVGTAGPLAPGSTGDESVMSILDSIDIDQYLLQKSSPFERVKKLSGPIKMIPVMLPAVRALRDPDWILKRYYQALPAQIKRIENEPDDSLSMHQMADQLTGLLHFFFYEHGLPLVFAPQIAYHRIKKIFEGDGDQVNEHLLRLGTSLPGNKTAEMGAMMSGLAGTAVIKEHTSVNTFIEQLEKRTLDPGFIAQWDEFVTEFGFRCPREIDVATPRINENPVLLFKQLKGMSTAPELATIFDAAKKKREAAHEALYALALEKGKRQAKSFEKMYQTWVKLAGYRETPKHYVIKVVDKFRKRALQVADTLVKAGRLDDRDQIFDLTIQDIDNALTDRSLDLRAIAAERVMIIDKIKRSNHIARIIDSRGKIFFTPRKEIKEGELTGIPISAGVVKGKVKVLHTANEKPLLPGEILVTRATDPGWTPLFLNARGVILEIGGALQHGAVVAREYGLPCVSGIDRATELLIDGQMVEVDGSRGIVRVLDGKIPISPPVSVAEQKKFEETAARREKAKTRQQRTQLLMRVIPLLIFPFVIAFLAAFATLLIQLLMGKSISDAVNQLGDIYRVIEPFVKVITPLIGAPILLEALWKNRDRILSRIVKRQ